MIPRRPLGKTALEVTEIGFGALEIGRDWAQDVNPDPSHPSEAEAARVLNGVLDLGINFIDTAPAYWNSEEFVGRAISHRRDEFILATKVGEHCDRSGSLYDYSAAATARFIDNSLRRLRTARVDLIQIHSASMDVLNKGETLGALQKAKDAGKVLHIGMTGGVAECICAIELGGYESVQVPYNLLALEAEKRLLPLAAEKGVGVILMRPLAGGKLSAKFERLKDERLREQVRALRRFIGDGQPAQDLVHLALGFVLAHPAVSTIIPGSRRLEAVESNLAVSREPLPAAFVEEVRAFARSLNPQTW